MGSKNDVMNSPAYANWSRISYLAPNLLDPMRLRGVIDLYHNQAMKADIQGNDAMVKDMENRKAQAMGALRDLYGISYGQ